MAISHAQPLLLLLVSLLILPAYGKIRIGYCNDRQLSPIKAKTVVISPWPVKRSGNGNFTITGYTEKEIPEGVIVKLKLTLPGKTISTKIYSLCDVTACPVSLGPIVLTFTNVFTEEELKGWGYYVWISISEDEDEKKSDKMMCIDFFCPIKRGSVSMLHQAT